MRVNVFSRNSVDLHYDNLAVLDVTKCDATSESLGPMWSAVLLAEQSARDARRMIRVYPLGGIGGRRTGITIPRHDTWDCQSGLPSKRPGVVEQGSVWGGSPIWQCHGVVGRFTPEIFTPA